jgi:hypothetical protein
VASIAVFLLTVFAKGQKANLSDKECNALAIFGESIPSGA